MIAKKARLVETGEGSVLYNLDPIIQKWHYEIDYIHSYAQDSPFFAGLSKGKLLGSACTKCHYKFATPRAHCMECGAKTEWMELPLEGKVHTFTTCYFGGEVGVDPGSVNIGMPVTAQFRRNSQFVVTDVYFVAK